MTSWPPRTSSVNCCLSRSGEKRACRFCLRSSMKDNDPSPSSNGFYQRTTNFYVRCREMILVAGKGEAVFPRTVQAILQAALQLRDRREQGQISERGVAVARGRLEARLDRSLQRSYRSPRNRRLANHLVRERDALFTFLNCPGLEATNWRAEQAIRPMVVTRKLWGGNRTTNGARTQGILVSILQTFTQPLGCRSSLLQTLICSPQPKVLDLTAPIR